MDELFSILNIDEIKRQSEKIASISDNITNITLYLTDIPIADKESIYPHYVFVITLNINENDLNAMFASYLTDEEIDTLVAKTPFFELPAKFTEIMENINPPPPDIEKMLKIAEEFRDSWTSANPSSACQNIARFYKPGIHANYFWDMIILASDSELPANMRTDADGKIQCYPAKENQAPATEAAAPKQSPPAQSQPAPQTELDPEELIKSIAVSYLSDTEVIIKFNNNKIEASYDKIGFREESKPWMMFIKILRNGKYNVGTYAKDNDAVKNREYNASRKLFSNFSKKFIPFINNKFSLNIPGDFNVFQNMKGFDHYGTYEPKFKIFDHSELKQKADIKNLSKQDTIQKIKELCQKKKSAIDETSRDQILVEIGLYANHAYNNKWITQRELHNWLDINDDEPSDYDVMSEIKACKEAKIIFDE